MLGPSDYGQLAVALAISGIVTAVVYGWCEPLVVRELADNTRHDFRAALGQISSAVGWVYLWGCITTAVIALISRSELVAVVGLVSLTVGAVSLVIGLARVRGDAATFVFAASFGLGGRAIGGTLMILAGAGIAGYFIGWLLLGILAFGIGMRRLGLQIKNLKPTLPTLNQFRYAVPISGVAVAFLMLQVVDRLTLAPIVGATALGIYALGYSLTEIGVNLAASILHVRRFPILMSKWRTDRQSALASLHTNILIAVTVPLLAIPIILVYGESGLRFIGGKEFDASSSWFMVLIAIGLAWCGAAQWLSVELQFSRQTMLWFSSIGLAVIVKVVTVAFFAGSAGILAGGYATVAAYAVMCVAILSVSRSRALWRVFVTAILPPSLSCLASICAVHLAEPYGQVLSAVSGVFSFILCIVSALLVKRFAEARTGQILSNSASERSKK